VILLASWVVTGRAQTQGGITGTVTDSSGAAIPLLLFLPPPKILFRKPALAGSTVRAPKASAKTAQAMLKPVRRCDIFISAAPITLRHAPDPISGAAFLSFIRRREASRPCELKHTRKSSDIEEKTPTTALLPDPQELLR